MVFAVDVAYMLCWRRSWSSRCADHVRHLSLLRRSSVLCAVCGVLCAGRWALGGIGIDGATCTVIMRRRVNKCKRRVDRGQKPRGIWRGRPKLDRAPSLKHVRRPWRSRRSPITYIASISYSRPSPFHFNPTSLGPIPSPK
jgi:hypothetical protein